MFEFERFYNLAFNPFAKTLPARDACATEDMRQVHARLDHLARTGGIGLVTADPGMGKTFAVRAWAAKLNPNTSRLVYTCLSTVSGVRTRVRRWRTPPGQTIAATGTYRSEGKRGGFRAASASH